MREKNHHPILDHNVNRRMLLKQLGLLSSGVIVGSSFLSCRKEQTKTPISLNFWGTGTLDIGKGWDVLEAENGIRIVFEDNNNDPGPVIAKLIQGGEARLRHVSGLQGGAERELAAKGAIVPWDLSLVPNFDKIWPFAKEISYTVVDGKRFGVPTVINADSMIYLPDKVGHIDSYAAVFDSQLKGRTAMEDAWINSVIFTAIYLKENRLQRISDPGNLTETELAEVMRFLTEKAREKQFRKLWSGWKDGVDLICSGEVWVMTGWEPIVYEAQRRGVKAEYAVPKEGYEGWSNDLVIHPGAEREGLWEAAHTLLDWELGGYYGSELASQRGYVVPTDDSVSYAELHPRDFDARNIKAIVENVKRKFFSMKGNVYWQNVRPDNYQLYEEKWAEFRAAF